MKYLPLAAFVILVGFAHSLHARQTKDVEQDNCVHTLKEKTAQAKTAISDSVVTAKVKDVLLRDPEVSGLKIHVTTKNRVVYLKGKVNTEYEQNLAVKLAKDIEGVKRVDYSHLNIDY